MVTFILGGIWHGAALKYIVFGAMHGVTLAALKMWNFKSPQFKLPHSLAVGVSFISFCVYAVIFRSPSLMLGVANVKGMFLGQNGEQIVNLDLLYLFFGVLAAIHYFKNRNGSQWAQVIRRLSSDQFAFATGAAWALIIFFTHNALRPFIYFQF
jgi:D-alanyl-lipoteichoic acid acyltransferase DltB (MBOAT superfamily)